MAILSKITLLVLALVAASCCTFKKCAQKYGTGEMHTITIRDTIAVEIPVYLEADSLDGWYSIQDILLGDTVTDRSESENLMVKFWYDKYSNLLHYRSTMSADTIYVYKNIPVKVKGDCPDTVILDKDKGASGIARLWEQVKSYSVGLLLLFIIGMIMLAKWKKLKSNER